MTSKENQASTDFSTLALSPATLANLQQLGYTTMTPIQAASLPPALLGKDLIAQASTGSGKTAAFALALLANLNPRRFAVQALVLCPTRELADQVTAEIRRLARAEENIKVVTLCGGVPLRGQMLSLEHGAHIVVGTPGRVMDHLQRGTLRLNGATTVVLDEADEMLDMGFREDIEAILERTPANCQRVLFSATMPPAILQLSKRFLREPEMLAIAQKTLTVPAIEQVYYEVRPHQKMDALCRVLDAQGFRKALVFCSTKRSVDEVTAHLQQRGYQSDGLHGDLAQSQRDRVMQRFRGEGLDILIATDVAARGIDVDDVEAVINYDIP